MLWQLQRQRLLAIIPGMEAVAHKCKGFKEAAERDIQQQLAMSSAERLRVSKILQ